MHSTLKKIAFSAVIALLLVIQAPYAAHAGYIARDLQTALDIIAPADDLPVIVTFAEKADLTVIKDKEKHQRRGKIIRTLKEKAAAVQLAINTLLDARGV